jgi:hypothetical protein
VSLKAGQAAQKGREYPGDHISRMLPSRSRQARSSTATSRHRVIAAG